jgi:serine/threonine protein kinase
MPFIRGQSLASHLSERRDLRDGLPRWLGVFEKLCHAMAYAHEQGIVHRDLKPGNVMLGDAGEVIVMDWGLAAVHHSVVSKSQTSYWVFGTPAYMPPEQAKGEAACDPRTDVFGLGAILCEILTGHPPYVGTDVADVTRLAMIGNLAEADDRLRNSPADEPLIRLVRRCLAADQRERPANAAEVAHAMNTLLARDRSTHRRFPAFRPEQIERFRAFAMAALALIASAVIGAMTARKIHADSPPMALLLTPSTAPAAHP